MKIKAQNNKLAKQLSNKKERIKAFGFDRAKRISARIDEMVAAKTLNDISRFPPARLHKLSGDMEGLFSVDISANYRLIFAGFTVNDEQVLDTGKIVKLVIVSVEDYH